MNRRTLLLTGVFILLAIMGLVGWRIYNSYNELEFSNGNYIPDIRLPDQNGDTISLYSLKGNLVLVQFWASWCGPCRMENQNLVNLYSKFQHAEMRDGGTFKIFSISVDKDKSKWKQAIEFDHMIWPEQVNDSLEFEKSIAKVFNVHSVPTTFLIDQNAMIIGVNLTPMQLQSVMEKRLK